MRFFTFLFLAALLIQCKSPEKPTIAEPVKSATAIKNPFTEKIKAEPKNASYYIEGAKWEQGSGAFANSIGFLDQLIKFDSTNAEAYLLRGEAFYAINKTRQSRDDWQRAVKLEPENLEIRLKLAQLFMVVEMVDASFEHLEKALAIDPNNAEAYFIAGMNYRTIKDTLKAIDNLQKAIDISPTYQAYEILGVTYAAMGQEIAVDYYLSALELNPNAVSVYYNLGVFYQDQGDWNKTLEYYTKTIQLNPGHVPALYAMGYVYTELKMWDEAISYFTSAINYKPNHYLAWFARGYAFEMLGDVANAEKSYLTCLSHIDDYPPALAAMERIKLGEEQTKQ